MQFHRTTGDDRLRQCELSRGCAPTRDRIGSRYPPLQPIPADSLVSKADKIADAVLARLGVNSPALVLA